MKKREIEEYAKKEYDRWSLYAEDGQLQKELREIAGNEEEVTDAFCTDLCFGTSGLRGILGPGTNRMNLYVIRRATRGLAAYLNGKYETPSVVIAYDSRKNSRLFAEETAAVLRGNDIEVFLFSDIAPVPLLSFSIGQLNASMGVMITASHNPRIFNGYKVYNSSGYQIVGEEADSILKEINKLDYFEETERRYEGIHYVGRELSAAFLDKIVSLSTVRGNPSCCRNLSVVYTPLNGAGNRYVREAFRRIGIGCVHVVPSQEYPDENFTTCPVPNPEKITAYGEGFKLLDETESDLIIATDPDCDRVGVCLCHDGMKVLLTGKQLGILLLDYLCQVRRPALGQIVIKSIVSAPLIEKIAQRYGLRVISTLTGFKYIGEIITWLDQRGRAAEYYFGFEESNGYLIDPFIRDKDGVSSAMAAAEMTAYYKSQGKDLIQRLEEIYREYGACRDRTYNYFFEGARGREDMERIMAFFRSDVSETIGGRRIVEKTDYMGDTDLPKADVIRFLLDNGTEFMIRPSGTEAKIKVYLFQTEGDSTAEAVEKLIFEQASTSETR